MKNAPNGWNSGRFEDFVILQRGFDLTKDNARKGNIPVISSSGITYYHDTAMVEPPGVITGRKGSLGKVFFVDTPFWPHDTTLWVKDFKGNHPEFVKIFLESLDLARFDAATSVPTLNRNNVHKLRTAFPPLPEQRKIAEILSTWDEAIAASQRLLSALRERKKGLMQRLLTGQVRFAGFDGEWKETRLGDIGDYYSGLSGKTKEDFGFGKPYITYRNIFENSKINPAKLDFVNVLEGESHNSVNRGDVFFTLSSETPDEVGMSSVLLDDLGECYLNSFCFGFRLRDMGYLLPEYARFLFRSDIFRRKMFKLAQGSTRYNISKREVMKFTFELPAIPEQEKIVSILDGCETEIDLLSRKLEALQAQKKGLMQRLLTGQVRVRV